MAARALHAVAAAAVLLVAALAAGHASPRADGASESGGRVRFRIQTTVLAGGARQTLSDATVEGASGTDVELDAGAGPFSMRARLKTDPAGEGRVRIKADVTTRRAAGLSARGVPLFEEDVQSRVVELAADGSESLVVMPFGRNPGGEELAIEVVPEALGGRARKDEPPRIDIADPGPDSWIRIRASRAPHAYAVEAALVDGDRVVAAGAGRAALEEAGAVELLAPDGSALARLDLTVESFTRDCERGHVAFRFDLAARSPGGALESVAGGWSGIVAVGEHASYELGDAGGRVAGGPATLRLRIVPVDAAP